MDTQTPLYFFFISLNKHNVKEWRHNVKEWRQCDGIDMQLMKTEELFKDKKFQQWKGENHISNRSFSSPTSTQRTS